MRKLLTRRRSGFAYPIARRALLVPGVLFFLTACAIPGGLNTQVVVSGQLLDAQGRAQSGQAIELTLPAEYGMSEIDHEHGSAEEFGRRAQKRTAVTDFLGSFSAEFTPVEYSTAWWVLPPLGRFPRLPPEPMILIRVMDQPSTWYQVLLKDGDIVYTILTSNASGLVPARKNAMRRRISGKPGIEERGDMNVWVSDLRIRGKGSSSP